MIRAISLVLLVGSALAGCVQTPTELRQLATDASTRTATASKYVNAIGTYDQLTADSRAHVTGIVTKRAVLTASAVQRDIGLLAGLELTPGSNAAEFTTVSAGADPDPQLVRPVPGGTKVSSLFALIHGQAERDAVVQASLIGLQQKIVADILASQTALQPPTQALADTASELDALSKKKSFTEMVTFYAGIGKQVSAELNANPAASSQAATGKATSVQSGILSVASRALDQLVNPTAAPAGGQ
jgi:hypothetical protein